jgi:hypothetical protein
MIDEIDRDILVSLWEEDDGWRGRIKMQDGRYYFHDIPETRLIDVFNILMEREKQ